jgi:hypothetical protein
MQTPSNAWLVEVDVVDPSTSVPARQTLIVESYDGTAAGAKTWAADVLDWCEVYVRSARPVYGELVEARGMNRLDDLPPRAIATPAPPTVSNWHGGDPDDPCPAG